MPPPKVIGWTSRRRKIDSVGIFERVVGRRPSSVASATVVDMAKPTTPEASDRLGNLLPTDPSAEDVERQADRLQIVPDFRLSSETVNRVPFDDLEQRRLRALGR